MYIGTQFWNQGRTEEIKDRVVHIGGELDENTPVIVATPYMHNPCGCC